jgi:hypothetical protein
MSCVRTSCLRVFVVKPPIPIAIAVLTAGQADRTPNARSPPGTTSAPTSGYPAIRHPSRPARRPPPIRPPAFRSSGLQSSGFRPPSPSFTRRRSAATSAQPRRRSAEATPRELPHWAIPLAVNHSGLCALPARTPARLCDKIHPPIPFVSFVCLFLHLPKGHPIQSPSTSFRVTLVSVTISAPHASSWLKNPIT